MALVFVAGDLRFNLRSEHLGPIKSVTELPTGWHHTEKFLGKELCCPRAGHRNGDRRLAARFGKNYQAYFVLANVTLQCVLKLFSQHLAC